MSYIPEKKTESLWWRDGVIYQIYPRSYMDTNGDGIGDLKGIIGKLDYLSDLGITAIWLSPVMPSPDADFGYDVANYKDIDPKFGTMDDYKNLIAEAHRRGIRIIMDLVLNHTSTEHPWFLESKKTKNNPFHDYYLWRDHPNNLKSTFTQRSAWEYVESCGQYYYHMFTVQQADLNWRNPEVYSEMMNIFRFWADLGTDGFRLDVFNLYFKDDQFRNNPRAFHWIPFMRQKHIYDCDRPEMDQAVRDIRKVTNAYKDSYVVGETFLSSSEKIKRYCGEDKLHGAFDFTFTHCKWDAPAFRKIIKNVEQNSQEAGFWPTYVLNNHDVERSASRFGLGEYDERLKEAAALLILLRGTPYIYYGEEIGMRETKLKKSEMMDPVGVMWAPFNRGRDGCRAPMQWNNQTNAGFTSGKPWNKIHPDYPERNVNAMVHDPNSLLTFYRQLIGLRKQFRCLQVGNLELLDQKNESVLTFTRKFGKEIALIAINFTQFPQITDCKELGSEIIWTKSFSNKTADISQPKDGVLRLVGEQAVLLIGK